MLRSLQKFKSFNVSPLNDDEGTLQGKSNCANYATMPPSTPWSTNKVQTQGNHEVMTYSTLQRREQRPHTVSLGKGGRRIAAKSQSFANATGYCVHRDGEFTTRSNYAFMNFSFTRVWKPRQKPKRFNLIEVRTLNCYRILPTWASLLDSFPLSFSTKVFDTFWRVSVSRLMAGPSNWLKWWVPRVIFAALVLPCFVCLPRKTLQTYLDPWHKIAV